MVSRAIILGSTPLLATLGSATAQDGSAVPAYSLSFSMSYQASDGSAQPVALASPMPVQPIMTFGDNDEVQTSVSGSGWTKLPPHACKQLILYNTTAADLEYRQGASGLISVPSTTIMPFPNGVSERLLCAMTNSDQIWVRRKQDGSETNRVIMTFRYEG